MLGEQNLSGQPYTIAVLCCVRSFGFISYFTVVPLATMTKHRHNISVVLILLINLVKTQGGESAIVFSSKETRKNNFHIDPSSFIPFTIEDAIIKSNTIYPTGR